MTRWIFILTVILFGGISSFSIQAADIPTNAPAATAPLAPAPPPAAVAPAPTTTGAMTPPADRPSTYTVVAGDTLWDLSHKFDCSIHSIKKLNKLKKNHLKPGQVLRIPPAHVTAAKPTASSSEPVSDQEAGAGESASTQKETGKKPAQASRSAKSSHADAGFAVAAKTKAHHHPTSLVAQPVQDFDIPTSTFASCPTPPSNGADEIVPAPDTITPTSSDLVATAPHILLTTPATRSTFLTSTDKSASPPSMLQAPVPDHNLAQGPAAPVPAPSAATKKSFANALADFFGGSHSKASESGAWGNRFLTETRNLASRGIGYDQSWRPEGETHSWAMDCSNTTRYLYQVTAGIQLPRTASDQYYYLHLQNKAWDVPTVANGFADCNFLRSNLKPGDLLFWENTYRPDRQPPITHVMIFLGTNENGQWIMAGSQSSHGGKFNPHRSGPDVYVFNPTRPSGGYTTWLGLVHHQGRFCAYGRPLEADVRKLSVAAND